MKKVKADEYYNDGFFEIARLGKHVISKNIMNSEQHQIFQESLKKNYIIRLKEIDSLIVRICDKVTRCDPIKLLMFSADLSRLSFLNISSEIQSSSESIITSRMTEYIQSILVSYPNHYIESSELIDQTEVFMGIHKDIEDLHGLIASFYMSWGSCLKDWYPEWDISLIENVVESQLLFLVRGQRYQVFEIEYLEKLILIHNEIFVNLFSLTSVDIING